MDTIAGTLYLLVIGTGRIIDNPPTFWFTGIIDLTFVVLYIVFTFCGGLGLKNLFLPQKETVFSSQNVHIRDRSKK